MEYPIGLIHNKDENQSNYLKISEIKFSRVMNHSQSALIAYFVYFKGSFM